MSVVAGIDLGTQSLKVLCYDAANKAILASASSALDVRSDSAGTAEQETVWWLQALHDAFSQIPDAVKLQVEVIAVSGQQHGFVAIDEAGDAVAPVKLWCDTSTTLECEELIAGFGGEARCLEVLGNTILPGYTASKILWLKKHKPDAFKRMATILLPHDYLNFYLSGERKMEVGDASGTGLLNIYTRQWDETITALIDAKVDDCLPELIAHDTTLGGVKADVATQLGLPAGIPVAVGGGDNMMAAIGTGNIDTGVVTISLGSSGTVYSHCQTPVSDKQGRLAAFCSSTGGWLPLLCTMNCTLATELMRTLLDKGLEQFEAALEQSPRGAEGVLSLPFFNGERTPNLPDSRATVLGLSANNCTAENLLRSVTESATYGLRMGIDALREKGIGVDEIRLTGGGSRSRLWRQMVADICQAPVTVITPDEGAAFGAALQALSLLQTHNSLSTLVSQHLKHDVARACQPKPEAVAEYNQIYQQYLRAIEVVTPFYCDAS